MKFIRLEEVLTRCDLELTEVEFLEREDLIEVKRTLDGDVVVSSGDADRIRCAAVLLRDLDVNPAGAEIILRMREQAFEMRRQFDEILEALTAEIHRHLEGTSSSDRRRSH